MAEPARTAGRLTRVVHVMGTAFSFDIRGGGVPHAVLDDVAGWLRWVDATFSTYRPESQVSRLARRETRLGECAAEVAEVLDLCADARLASGGYFTATPHGALDPSGVVKGWAIERASEMLRAAGSTDHCVNGGGDIRLVGERSPGEAWRVGIAHPLRPGMLAAVIAGRELGVATSGTAERGGHVVDPFTGRPATDLASLTVVASDLTRADTYATAAVAMGNAARGWLASLDDVEALAVTATGKLWHTPGFARHVAA